MDIRRFSSTAGNASGRRRHSRFFINIDAGRVKALNCPFQQIQLKHR